MRFHASVRTLTSAVCIALVVVACSSATRKSGFEDPHSDSPATGNGIGHGSPAPFNLDAAAPPSAQSFFADDPPQKWCGPANGAATPPPAPGGTPQCPDDKNVEGCPCGPLGTTAPCWPGKRANRHHGTCVDGMTMCVGAGESGGAWSACQGAVLPDPTAKRGPSACSCFSQGTWSIANSTPCTTVDPMTMQPTVMNSSVQNGNNSLCPDVDPQTAAMTPWSTNSIKADCAGHFKLCYSLKAGDINHPDMGSCTIMTTCVDAEYPVAGQEMKLPDLPGWASNDPACVAKFANGGGWGEMTVLGQSYGCDQIDDGGGMPFVFNREPYCPLKCSDTPDTPECKTCATGMSNMF
jgi:hypothetical protein